MTFQQGRQSEPYTLNSYAFTFELAAEVLTEKLGFVKPEMKPESIASESGSLPKMLGTGFGITYEGHILTNYHVIEGAQKILVKINDKTLEARLIAKDVENDLAVIHAPSQLSPVSFSPINTPKLGATIFAVGFPMPTIQGLEPKITKGVVSSLKGIRDDDRHLQIDAAIQPGNSGGPLADELGNVVGVVNAKINDVGILLETGNLPQNVNYAINNETVKKFLYSILEVGGKIRAGKNDAITFEEAVAKITNSTVLIEAF